MKSGVFRGWYPLMKDTNIRQLIVNKNGKGLSIDGSIWVLGSHFENIGNDAIIIHGASEYLIIERSRFINCQERIFSVSVSNDFKIYSEKVCLRNSRGPFISCKKPEVVLRELSSVNCGNEDMIDFMNFDSELNFGMTDIYGFNHSHNVAKRCSGICFGECNIYFSSSIIDCNTQINIILFFRNSKLILSTTVFTRNTFEDSNQILYFENVSSGFIQNCIFSDNKGVISNTDNPVTLINCYIKDTSPGSVVQMSPAANEEFDLYLIDEHGCDELPRRMTCGTKKRQYNIVGMLFVFIDPTDRSDSDTHLECDDRM